jgi:flavin reductase (DIM6/NTAB) family NADH-FMN oxidoreductase RutF
MKQSSGVEWVDLDTSHPIWDRFFWVAPLVLIGTREESGKADLAPKHMAVPLGWGNYFGFVCTPSHATYRNARREEAFTVSYPRPDQIVVASLAASPRCEDGDKAIVGELPTRPAQRIQGVVLDGAMVTLECELVDIFDGFGDNSLIVGRVLAARAHRDALLREYRDPQSVLAASPLLAYLNPGRFSVIHESNSFPFPDGFKR